ncbi:osmotically-inducible lipoprotein OsmB, partial [Yersinia enterocolitica]
MMMINKRFATAALALTLALSLSACSNMSKRDRNTAI